MLGRIIIVAAAIVLLVLLAACGETAPTPTVVVSPTLWQGFDRAQSSPQDEAAMHTATLTPILRQGFGRAQSSPQDEAPTPTLRQGFGRAQSSPQDKAATATSTPTPTPTPTSTPTATPTPTAIPVVVSDDLREARLSAPVPQGGALCGVVDLLDFPMDPPHGLRVVFGGRDFGVYRSNYGGRHTGEDWWNGSASFGTPVHSIGHGTVTFAEPWGWGADKGVVIVRHVFSDGRAILSFYGHLDPPQRRVERGPVRGARRADCPHRQAAQPAALAF